jgi:SAM-dependent methyltransferase
VIGVRVGKLFRCGKTTGVEFFRQQHSPPTETFLWESVRRLNGEFNVLYFYGLRLGFQSLLRAKINKELLAIPVSYWRAAEYKIVFNELEAERSDKILDIGSPKLLSRFLAHKVGCQVYSTDVDDYFTGDYLFFQTIKDFSTRKLHAVVQDGRRLAFSDRQFTKIYSISVIEHIPENGDTECVREIARVLAPGGRCILTVPFAAEGGVDFREEDFYWSKFSVKDPESGRVFFQRRYSENDLRRRLIEPSGLRAVKIRYIGERIMTNSSKELCEVLHPITGPIQPLFSTLFLSKPKGSWKNLKKPLCAVLVLEK